MRNKGPSVEFTLTVDEMTAPINRMINGFIEMVEAINNLADKVTINSSSEDDHGLMYKINKADNTIREIVEIKEVLSRMKKRETKDHD